MLAVKMVGLAPLDPPYKVPISSRSDATKLPDFLHGTAKCQPIRTRNRSACPDFLAVLNGGGESSWPETSRTRFSLPAIHAPSGG